MGVGCGIVAVALHTRIVRLFVENELFHGAVSAISRNGYYWQHVLSIDNMSCSWR